MHSSLTTDINYQDTYHVALGNRYRLNDKWLVNSGFAWDSSMVEDQNRTVTLPAGEVFSPASAQVINGIRNRKAGMSTRPADHKFVEVVRLLTRIQAKGAIGIIVRREKEGQEERILLFHPSHLSQQALRDVAELSDYCG